MNDEINFVIHQFLALGYTLPFIIKQYYRAKTRIHNNKKPVALNTLQNTIIIPYAESLIFLRFSIYTLRNLI